MQTMINTIVRQLVFWMAWVLIPIIMEIIPAFGGFVILLKKKIFKKKRGLPAKLPEITIIIPVYNSADTLDNCIQSVYNSSYPKEQILLLVVDNKSKDNSFKVFCECQKKYEKLSMQWMSAEQGKSKALNMALFNSTGKYIIHIDSDGQLEKNAIVNMVDKFEMCPEVDCMTGVIMTHMDMIEKTKSFLMKLTRKAEFMEYAQAFLAGRNYQSEKGNIYTLSGAFSGFRKSTILKTQLYNTDTVCEDTHVSFQIKKLLNKNICLCENAVFYVDPIENYEKLYTQRQRWQVGELEVTHMFYMNKKRNDNILNDSMLRVLVFDHTFAFPRMIWYFALLCLGFMNYPIKLIIFSIGILYFLYIISGMLFYINICMYLKEFKELKKYYRSKWYMILIMPLFNFVVFWIRFAGIINSITNRNGWSTNTLKEEKDRFVKVISGDFRFISVILKKLRHLFNN